MIVIDPAVSAVAGGIPRSACASAVLALAVLAPSLAAQHLFTRTNGDAAGDVLGLVIADAGDIDGDGVRDVAFGIPEGGPQSNGRGRVKVVSGGTGALIRIWDGPPGWRRFGSGLGAVGDVNGDGKDDLAVGSWADPSGGSEAGRVSLVSGLDGSLLWFTDGAAAGDRLGWSLASIGDVDDDGFADLAAGAPLADVGATSSGSVYLLSGFDGGVLDVFHGPDPGDQLGRYVAAAGDLDGDGVPDLLGGTEFPIDITGAVGLIRGWSGADSTLLFDESATVPDTLFGRSFAGVGDLDGDGHDDVAVGLATDDTLATNAGRVEVMSGLDGSVILVADPPESAAVPGTHDINTFFGLTVSGLDDLDGDGVPEFLVGESQRDDIYLPNPTAGNNCGAVHVVDGSDGSIVYTVYGKGAGVKMGSGLASLGDLDGDGLRDWAGGQPGSGSHGVDSGEGRVYHSKPNWTDVGLPLTGLHGAPVLAAEPRGGLFAGKPVKLTLSNALEDALVVMILGFARIDAPLEGGTLVPSPDILVVFANGPAGSVAFGADFPPGVPTGFQFWIQDWIVDPAGPFGWSASNALEATTP